MGRYCYSREIDTIEGKETFAMVEMASFDEAKKEVNKGVHDRRLELAEKHFDVKIAESGRTPVVESKDNANPTPGNAATNLPDSLNKHPEGKEGEGSGGAS